MNRTTGRVGLTRYPGPRREDERRRGLHVLRNRSPCPGDEVDTVTTVSPLALVIGVPRSDTTLLRFLFDGHPAVTAPAETPWITGGYGPPASIRQMVAFLTRHERGIENLGGTVTEDDVMDGARLLMDGILSAHLAATDSEHVVLKTPQDILYLPFLHQLFPASPFIHIVRDGRDVALSTSAVEAWQTLGPFGRGSVFNALARWADWVERPTSAAAADPMLHQQQVHYEDLVSDPETVMRDLTEFVGIEYDSEMLAYARSARSLPTREAGSRDVAGQSSVTSSRALRWRSSLSPTEAARVDLKYGDVLTETGYPLCMASNPYRRDQLLFARLSLAARAATATLSGAIGGSLRRRVAARASRTPSRQVASK